MSLSANDQASYPKSSGKTPPPAPSAAYARRAREMQGDGAYRPPALRALAQGATPGGDTPPNSTVAGPRESDAALPLPPNNFPAGFRRARAGTLPSNVQLAAQRFASTLSSTPDSPSYESSVDGFSNAPSPVTQAPPSRPGLRHTNSIASSAASSAGTERNSRLRSGSLTLPSGGGLGNAFGPSIFASAWQPGRVSTLDELRSDSSGAGDDFDVHTLDYLGLVDDGGMGRMPPPPATVSELRNQAQAAIAGSLNSPSRIRANTVSNPYRNRGTASAASLFAGTPESNDEQYDMQQYDASALLQSGLVPGSLMAKGFKDASHLSAARPRATSIGNLDDTVRSATQRRATVADPPKDIVTLGQPTVTAIMTDRLNNIARGSGGSPTVRFPANGVSYLGAGGARDVSPRAENRDASGAQIQTPSRSLWIGNLDPSMTSEALIHVFAPYGAIESLRLLPEKECGFVNFVDQEDAVRAKDDVLNRLGGIIGMANGQAVRIGYGKADSAPVAPAKTPGGLNSPASAGPGSKPSPGGLMSPGGTLDAQLQSSPTRALWIGSIPSSTTPATILNVFSPFGPIESARVLTHKNCGFINFERLDDAVRARKALNGRDVLGSDVGAIRIGFAKVPTKNGAGETAASPDESAVNVGVQGVGDLTVGATIHALRSVKGASTIPADQQVLGGAVENYRSHLLLSMIGQGTHTGVYNLAENASGKPAGWTASITEQQMIMKEISVGSPDAEADIHALAEFRPPTMYYTTIPLVSERQINRRWDASKLRELRKRLDSPSISTEEVDQVAGDFLDGEIVDLASDWLGNTVVQKLFEKCSGGPRFAMLERLAPHLAMIGVHKNGTWAGQKIIECVSTEEEVALICQNVRAYTPPLLLDQFGNYVVQCCLRFGSPANDFIFDAMIDRLWEVAQGRFGARSMRACLESQHITLSQQRRLATAIILNSIPLATNPNGALLLTWLLDTSGFSARYKLLAPRFTPHLSHLCTHKLASLTVLRIINQKVEPEASHEIVQALFNSPGDHVLIDVLNDQVNGVNVVQKILSSPFVESVDRPAFVETTKRVLIELKVIATQAYRRLVEEVGLPAPNFPGQYSTNIPLPSKNAKAASAPQVPAFNSQGLSAAYTAEPGLANVMAALQLQTNNAQGLTGVTQTMQPQLQINPNYGSVGPMASRQSAAQSAAFSPTSDPFNPFALRSPEFSAGSLPPQGAARRGGPRGAVPPSASPPLFGSPSLSQASQVLHHQQYGVPAPQQNAIPPQMYQHYMYHMLQQQQQQQPNSGGFHA